MITHGHDVYYSDDKVEYADFWVIREDGVKWEVCRAERGKERKVIQPMVHGYWLDVPWVHQYVMALHSAIEWVEARK